MSPDDWQLYRLVRRRALDEDPQAFTSTLAQWSGKGDTEQRWRSLLEKQHVLNLIAMLDGRPVGTASGIPGDGPSSKTIVAMWVAPEARGKGIARELIAAVESWAGNGGASTVRLSVMSDNTSAIGFYEKLGFAFDAVAQRLRSNDARRELAMTKPIGRRD